jgi:aminoglycoside 6'-N-acetyltransferase
MNAIDAATVTLEPFDAATDLPRLAAWLGAPHVAPWWPEAATQLEDARHRPPGAGHVLIAVDGRPVGYMRWQRSDPAALIALGLADIPAGAVDMDILIGDPSRVLQGIGRRAVRLLHDRLLADPSIPLVAMVTAVGNEVAIRCFRAAGLGPHREYDDPRYGRCLVMVARAAPGTSPASRRPRPPSG